VGCADYVPTSISRLLQLLDREELRSPALLAMLHRSSLSSDCRDDEELIEAFLAAADSDGDGQVSFVEFALACAGEDLQIADDVLAAVLEEFSERVTASPPLPRRRSHTDRFDEMLEACLEWEDAYIAAGGNGIPAESEGRLTQVLLGTFAGARCEPVASALRLCYEEYSPLRMGGDLIFQLLKRVVATRIEKGRTI